MTNGRSRRFALGLRHPWGVSLLCVVALIPTTETAAYGRPSGRAAHAVTATKATCPKPDRKVRSVAPGRGKTVALTFDDGPGPNTSAILKILAKNTTRATFFNMGEEMVERPGLVRREYRQGHALGNHSWDHPEMTRLSRAAQAKEMDRTSAEQFKLVGAKPCLFRPPYGEYNATTLGLAARRAMSVWTWSVDTEDWRARGSDAQYWIHRIVSRAEAGVHQRHPVVLMHNADGPGDPATVAALPGIIRFYRKHGYAFVDLAGRRGFAPDAARSADRSFASSRRSYGGLTLTADGGERT